MSDRDAETLATDRCARCDGPFHCGVADPEPCACTSAVTSADLSALGLPGKNAPSMVASNCWLKFW